MQISLQPIWTPGSPGRRLPGGESSRVFSAGDDGLPLHWPGTTEEGPGYWEHPTLSLPQLEETSSRVHQELISCHSQVNHHPLLYLMQQFYWQGRLRRLRKRLQDKRKQRSLSRTVVKILTYHHPPPTLTLLLVSSPLPPKLSLLPTPPPSNSPVPYPPWIKREWMRMLSTLSQL